jgi:hypothetical protein
MSQTFHFFLMLPANPKTLIYLDKGFSLHARRYVHQPRGNFLQGERWAIQSGMSMNPLR